MYNGKYTVGGPDVSHWNKIKNWTKLAASGYAFVGFKASEGNTYVDKTYSEHVKQFRNQPGKLKLAILYHFAKLKGDPTKQAEHFLNVAKPASYRERLCLDVEGSSFEGIDLSNTDLVMSWLETFFLVVMKAHKQRPILYTSQRVWASFSGPPAWALAPKIDLWLPRYNTRGLQPKVPQPWSSWLLWQYTDGAVIPYVIQGAAAGDMNVFNGDMAAFDAYVTGRKCGSV